MTTQFLTLDPTGTIPNVGLKNVLTTGTVIFLDSNNGTDTNDGLTPATAVATLSAALALATANKHDVIRPMPGHAETLAAELDITTEGVSIIGEGNGDNRPILTFDTADAAQLKFSADNLRVSNIIFKCDKDGQDRFIEIVKAYCVVDHCEFWEGTAKQCDNSIAFTDAAAKHCKILDNLFVHKTAGATSAIKINAALSNLEIARCRIVGDWSDAGIQNPTGKVATELSIHDNYIENDKSGDHAIQLVSACTGGIYFNVLFGDTIAAILDPGSCKCAGNRAVVAIDQGSVEVPLGASAEDFIGRDNSNNNAATTNVVSNADSSILERLELVQSVAGATVDITTTDSLHGKVGTDTEMADSSLFDILCGGAGVPGTFPAAAAPADNVSLAEILREVYDLGERVISSAGVVLTGGDVADVFTIAGGPIEIIGLWVDITTAVSANACLIHFESDPTVGASNTDLAEGTAAPDIASAALGDVFHLNGDSQDVMKKAANGTDLPVKENQNGGILCPVGGIDMKLSTSDPSTGAATLWLRYKPLGRGVTVT